MLQPHTSTAVPAIVPLPPAACAQVRSQVVVASVAAALGEVVANALDAGATEVHVELALQPDSLGFRVADTGHGIPAASLALLGQRFATSKRAGSGAAPRGEGLAAIREAATAVEVTTRAAGSFETFAVTLRPGGQAPRTQLALEQRSRQGTVVAVRSLFAAQPVRLKALLAAGCVGAGLVDEEWAGHVGAGCWVLVEMWLSAPPKRVPPATHAPCTPAQQAAGRS